MAGYIIAIAIIAAAAAYVAYRIVRRAQGRPVQLGCSCCNKCKSCPAAGSWAAGCGFTYGDGQPGNEQTCGNGQYGTAYSASMLARRLPAHAYGSTGQSRNGQS